MCSVKPSEVGIVPERSVDTCGGVFSPLHAGETTNSSVRRSAPPSAGKFPRDSWQSEREILGSMRMQLENPGRYFTVHYAQQFAAMQRRFADERSGWDLCAANPRGCERISPLIHRQCLLLLRRPP